MSDEPEKVRRRRTKEIDVVFGANNAAEGWAWDVPSAFKAALDIKYIVYKRLKRGEDGKPVKKPDGKTMVEETVAHWTRGRPPHCDFNVGDTFLQPPGMRSKPWDTKAIQKIAQVTDTSAEEITFVQTTYKDGSIAASSTHTITQQQFAAFLKTDQIPSNQADQTPAHP